MHPKSTLRVITATVTALCLLFASCGSATGDDEQADSAATSGSDDSSATTQTSPSTTTTSTTTAPPSTTSTTIEPEGGEPTELAAVLDDLTDPIELAPGRYTDQALTSIGQLDLAEPALALWYEDSVFIMRDAAWGEGREAGNLTFMAPLGVMPPEQAGIHQPHEPAVPDTAVPVPADLGAWLESIEQVEIRESGSFTTAAGNATWYDFIVPDDAQTFDCGFHPSCIGLIAGPGGVWVYRTGVDYRLYQFDGLPGLVAIAQAPPEQSETVVAGADEILAGLGTRG